MSLQVGLGVEALLARGESYRTRGDTQRAESYFVAAWRGGAPQERVLPRLLELCVATGQLRAGLEYVERALRERPGEPRLRVLRVILLWALGDGERARFLASEWGEGLELPAELSFLWGRSERELGRDGGGA